jgi:hypothetical protein
MGQVAYGNILHGPPYLLGVVYCAGVRHMVKRVEEVLGRLRKAFALSVVLTPTLRQVDNGLSF